ncbi:MAG: flagellar hook-associated protein FlgK [Alphaproteobacteria bacterium]
MSLTNALYNTFAGINTAEVQISVVSENVTNADKAGYTRKQYDLQYSTAGGTSVPISGTIVSANADPYLLEEVIEDITAAAESQVKADYLGFLSDQLGTTEGSTTISSSVSDFAASLDQLSVTPEDDALKSKVVSDAEAVASQLRNASQNVQSLRTQADQAIDSTVDRINDLVIELDTLNKQIATAQVQGLTPANLEDERNAALQELAALVDVQYFINSNNELQIYMQGYSLLSSQPNLLSYEAAGSLTGDVSYPAQLDGIMLNGTDITGSVKGGELGALVELRDVTLVEEQDKLDEYATVLMDQLNTLSNQGSSSPPQSQLTGDLDGLTGADAFSGTGSVRIAVLDQAGVVTNYADLNIAAYATVSDVINDINAQLGPDVTASLNADGELVIAANNAGEGVAINELDSDVGADNRGFSHYFGLNNIYDGEDASDIVVSQYLQDDFAALGITRLSDDAGLAVGDLGVAPGAGEVAKELNEQFFVNVSFAQAGNFPALTSSLSDYGNKIMSDVAGRASDALQESSTNSLILGQTLTSLQNAEGVNIDEEMAHLVDLEAKYEAAATLLSVLQEMYDTLISSVR